MQSRQSDECPAEEKIMSTRSRKILIAGALVAATSTLSAQAADQSTYFEQQRADSSSPHALQPAEGPTIPAPGSDVANKARPTAPVRSADYSWWQEERAEDDGYVWPTPLALRRGNVKTVRGDGDQ
jgi:hypothetical protein